MAGHQICLQVWLAVSLLNDAIALAGQVYYSVTFCYYQFLLLILLVVKAQYEITGAINRLLHCALLYVMCILLHVIILKVLIILFVNDMLAGHFLFLRLYLLVSLLEEITSKLAL